MTIRRTLAPALCGLAMLALAGAAGALEPLDLLRPGSRPADGLAGDPFRSPFVDGLSWAGTELGAPRGVKAKAVSSRALDGGFVPAEVWGTRVDWIVNGPAPLPGPRWVMAARVTRPAFDAGYSGTSGGVRVQGGGRALDLALEAPPVIPGMRVRGAFPVAGEREGLSRAPASLEVAWSGSPRLALQGGVAWARATDRLSSTIEGEPIEASLNLGTRRYQGDLRSEIRPGLAVEASVSSAGLSPVAGRSPAPVYGLEPAGTTRLLRGGIEWRIPRGPRLLLRRSEQRASLEADVSWGGERFGHLNYAHAESRSWLGAAEWTLPRSRGRMVLDLESARGEARARAEVESWPFSEGLADLLGARAIARGEGSLRWEVAHAALERGLGRAARLRTGLAWYDLRPQGGIETWQPMFLVFGRTNVQQGELDVRRVQLGEIALGADLRFGALDLGFDVRQVVFAKAMEARGMSGVPAAPPAAEAGDAPGGSSAGRGLAGNHMELRVGRRF